MLAMRARHLLKPNKAERLRSQIKNAVERELDARVYRVSLDPDMEETDAGACIGYADTELGTITFCVLATDTVLLTMSSTERDMRRAESALAETAAAPMPKVSLFKSLKISAGAEIFTEKALVYLPAPSKPWLQHLTSAILEEARLEKTSAIAAALNRYVPSGAPRIAWELYVTTFGADNIQWIALRSRSNAIVLWHDNTNAFPLFLDAHGIQRIAECQDTLALLSEALEAHKRVQAYWRLHDLGHTKVADWLAS